MKISYVENTKVYHKKLKQKRDLEYQIEKERVKKEYYDNGIVKSKSKYRKRFYKDLDLIDIKWELPDENDAMTAYADSIGTQKIIDKYNRINKYIIILLSIIIALLFTVSLRIYGLYESLILIIVIVLVGSPCFMFITATLNIKKESEIYVLNKNAALKIGKFSEELIEELLNKSENIYYIKEENRYIISKY